MTGGTRPIIRSLIILLLSHVLIFFVLYHNPALTQAIEGFLPPALNGTLSLAMSAAVAGVRRPTAFLTRSIILSNPQHRAGKPIRKDIARTYRVFTELSSSIRRSRDPYKIATSTSRSFSSSSRASASATAKSLPPMSLHVSASSCGKKEEYHPAHCTFDYIASDNNGLGLQPGSTIQEKRNNRPPSGQDAYFVTQIGNDNHATAFAIADGVGGWTDRGIDPADFSHGLCSHMARIALGWTNSTPPAPRQLLKLGYEALLEDPDIVAGGSTACVGIVDGNGRMRIANLGDSGFLQLRLGRVHHYSDPQTHAFNTPYQMSLTPPDILRQAKVFGGLPLNDDPRRADVADYMLQHGDVVVLATDGVWDNLDAQDVLQIVSRIMRQSGAWIRDQEHGFDTGDKIFGLVERGQADKMGLEGTLQATIAAAIVGEAKTAGLSRKRDGPFAKAYRKEVPGEAYHGGKPDDIAVLVAISVENNKKEIKAKL